MTGQKSQQPKVNLKQKKEFHKGTASLFSAVAALFGVVIILRTFAAPGTYAPQHVYTDWAWNTSQRGAVNNSIESPIKIESDSTQVHPAVGYYYMSSFFFDCNGCSSPNGSGYMGIQTNGEAGTFRGKVAIFSLFGAAIGVENGSAGSVCSTYGNGFDGYANTNGSSCRIPLNWQAGESYVMRMQLVATDAGNYTWQASARNTANNQEFIIGKIKTPIAWAKLQGYLINVTEYYSPGRAECDAPYSKVIFGTPTVNGSFTPTSKNSYLGEFKGCNQSKATETPIGIRHEVGNPAVSGALPALPTGGTYISDLAWTSGTTGYGVITKDQSVSNNGSPINLAGKTFTKGLGVHAVSEIKYNLGGNYSKFVSYVNIQYGAGGKVTYEAWADNAKLFDSGPMDGFSYTKAVNIDVTGKKELKLIVTDAGDGITADWAAWADARLIGSITTTPPPNRPPTASITGPASGSVNQTLTYNTSANDPDVNLNKIEVLTSPHGAQSFTLVKTCSLTASSSGTCSVAWAPSAAGSYDVVVNAYDSANGKCSGNPNVTYPYYDWLSCGTTSYINLNVVAPNSNPQVSPPPPAPPVTSGDKTVPTVTITSPVNGATIYNGTYITAKATDNVGVVKMQVLIDGAVTYKASGNTLAYTWVSYYAAAGNHTITVQAYDAAGNVGQSSIIVKK